jgi:hypothetical protein
MPSVPYNLELNWRFHASAICSESAAKSHLWVEKLAQVFGVHELA